MDFLSNFLTPLSGEQKTTVTAVLCQWPVMASMFFLGSGEYRLLEYWEQLILSLAAVILVTFISFVFTTSCLILHHIKGVTPSFYLLSLPTFVSSVFQIAFCDVFTLLSFKSTFIWTAIIIYTSFFIMGFRWKKHEGPEESNGTDNIDGEKEKQ